MKPRLNKIVEESHLAPEIPYYARKDNPAANMLEFDVSSLSFIFGAILHDVAKTLMAELLDPKSGFNQSDGTYALFNYKLLELESLVKSEWDGLDPVKQHRYTELAKRAVTVFVTSVLERQDG